MSGDAEAPATPSKLDAYLAKRFNPQLEWYERRAANAKRRHYGLAGTQITATAMLPVATQLPQGALGSALLGAFALIAASFAALGGFHSDWLRYRNTAQALNKLRDYHALKLAPFDGPDADDRLIAEAESLLDGEREAWTASASQQTGAAKAEPKNTPKGEEETG